MFLGINVSLTASGSPLWFQTMVYRGSIDGTLGAQMACGTFRYSAFANALTGHFMVCEKVKSGEIGE